MRIFQRLFDRPKPLPPGVHFYHHRPSTPPNLGDELCSPRHYFHFDSDIPILILGGGAFKNLGIKQALQFDARVRIAWGVGLSYRLDQPPQALQIDEIMQAYSIVTTRDPSVAKDGIGLLPCVSVLHSIVDLPPGDKLGLFLNDDPKASGSEVDRVLGDYYDKGFVVGSNAMPAVEFMRVFASTGEIVTNSYHAAYWGLLSGRSVRIAGYSTKFLELLELFGLPQLVSPYKRGSSQGLEQAVHLATKGTSARLRDPNSNKSQFREMNLEFAAGLDSLGVAARPL